MAIEYHNKAMKYNRKILYSHNPLSYPHFRLLFFIFYNAKTLNHKEKKKVDSITSKRKGLVTKKDSGLWEITDDGLEYLSDNYWQLNTIYERNDSE